MPCPDISAIQSNACLSEIGRATDEIELLQLTAQSALAWAEANNPGVDYSLDEIQDRACASGIGWEQSEINLLRVIGQNLCNQIS
jgi:hypothetical protein